jgi:hypothetical protein
MQLHAVALERTVKSLSMRNKEEVKVLQGRIAQAERKEVAVAKKVERDESLLKDRIEAATIKKKVALDAVSAASRSTKKAERQLKESKDREKELLRETREAKAKQHGFVQQLQDRMEIGGMQMYCIERGNEGMFMPKNELHVQLQAWE